MEIIVRFRPIRCRMITASPTLTILGCKYMVHHQTFHRICIFWFPSQFKQHLCQLHPRHRGTGFHHISRNGFHIAVFIMFRHTDSSCNVHLPVTNIIPCACHFTEQWFITGNTIQTQESHKIHLKSMWMHVRLKLIYSQSSVCYGIQTWKGIPTAPFVYITNHPKAPVQILLFPCHFI